MKSPVDAVINDFSARSDMSNFRIDADGALTKREGYFELGNFSESVRGICTVEQTTYAVIGQCFWKLHNSEATLIGEMIGCSFESDSEKASLFCSGDIIYIIGGGEFYFYDMREELFSLYPVYVPFILKNANPAGEGNHAEVTNLISDHRKIEYKVTVTAVDYYFPEAAESIVSVYLDGSNVPPDFYSFQSDGTKSFIRMANSEMLIGAESLVVEYVSKSQLAKFKKQYLSNVNAFLYSDEDETRLFLYGKNTNGKILFAADDTASSPLEPCLGYVTPSSYFSLVDGNRDIYKIFRYNDSVLAVTSKGTHEIKKRGSSSFYSRIVSSDFSSTAKSDIIVTDNTCYSFSNDGLFTLSYTERDEAYSVRKIDIPDSLSPGRLLFSETLLHLNKLRDELWCCYGDTVAVYNIHHKLWYKFTGITVDYIFTHASQTAFSHAGSVFLFDENTYTDNNAGFEASYESGIYDLGNIFNKKTLFGFGAVIDNIYGAALNCTLKNDKDMECHITVSVNRKTNAEKFVKRVHTRLGDSYYVTLRMVSPAGSPPVHVKSIMIRYR